MKEEEEEVVEENLLRKQMKQHLSRIGNFLSSSCPAASRFYMANVSKILPETPDSLKNESNAAHLCQHCGSIWTPENHRVRVQPCPSVNQHLKKLLKLEAEQPWLLNNYQKRKLRKFRDSTSKIVYNCFICKKKIKFPGNKKSKFKHRGVMEAVAPLKIKRKKGDLNAGLFIPSPCITNINQRTNLGEVTEVPFRISPETPLTEEINKKENTTSDNAKNLRKNGIVNESISGNKDISLNTDQRTPTCAKGMKNAAQKQSSRKKIKKTLLAKILKQEQNNQKKTKLSSFLISL